MDFKKILPFLVVIAISIPALIPLSQSGFFPMHDDTQPARIYEMAQSLKDGQFPVRWVRDLGYGFGYPIFNFYAPLPYYFGAALTLIGVDLIVATKYMFIVGMLLASVGMYLLCKRLWGEGGGVLAAGVYMYAPYHAVELYVRGAVGELWAYGLLPWVFLSIWEVVKKPGFKNSWLTVGSVSLAALILSHNIAALETAGFIGLTLLLVLVESVRSHQYAKFWSVITLGIFGLGLSAFFWLPAVGEAGLTKTYLLTQGASDYHQHFVFVDQLWDSPWGYAGSAAGRADGMSFKLGKAQILLALLSLASLVLLKKKKLRSWPIAIVASLGFFLSLFMALEVSRPVWEAIPLLPYIQYPWRFLPFMVFFLSVVSGILPAKVVSLWPRPATFTIIGFLVVGVIFVNLKYFQPQYLNAKTSPDYVSKEALTWSISKISDEYLPKNFPVPQMENDIAQGILYHSSDIIIEQAEVATGRVKLVAAVTQPTEVAIAIAYFPGWQFFINQEHVIPIVKDGLPTIQLTVGKQIITAYFANSPIRSVGNSISTVFLILILYTVWNKGVVLGHEEKK